MKEDLKDLDWDDLRYFLAAARTGSLSEAARTLGVSVATVGRRIERLESSLALTLVYRGPHGISLSYDGERMFKQSAGFEQSMRQLVRHMISGREQGGEPQEEVCGEVIVSVLDSVVPLILHKSSELAEFLDYYPALELEIRGESHLARLATREADVIVRASRPSEPEAVAYPSLELRYGVYGHPDYLATCDPERMRVLSYVQPFSRIPEMIWLRERYGQHRFDLRLKTMAEIAIAIEGGVGVGLLPHVMAGPQLECLERAVDLAPRQLWVATHRDIQRLPRIRVVTKAILRVLRRLDKEAMQRHEWMTH